VEPITDHLNMINVTRLYFYQSTDHVTVHNITIKHVKTFPNKICLQRILTEI